MEQIDYFKKEIDYIQSDDIREAAIYMIGKLPSYFFEVAASSTGKYHPDYAQGDGGLLRHTKAAVCFAHELYQTPIVGTIYTQREKDLMLFALMIHDGLKYGREKGKYTVFEHSLLVVDLLKEEKEHLHLSEDEFELLCSVVASHNGPAPFNRSSYSDIILPEPKTKYQRFVHMCDFLASRKCFHFHFANDQIVE